MLRRSNKIKVAIPMLAFLLAACGTLEVGVEEAAVPVTMPVETATKPPFTPTDAATDKPIATPVPDTATPVPTPMEVSAGGPAGWSNYYDKEFGLSLWFPPGTYVEEREPATPVFCGVNAEECITEKQIFSITVFQREMDVSGTPGSSAFIEIKLVVKPEDKSVHELAELFSKRCPGPLTDPIEQITLSPDLIGFRYGCEGMMDFNEFWAQAKNHDNLLLSAAWSQVNSPLADEILATVTME